MGGHAREFAGHGQHRIEGTVENRGGTVSPTKPNIGQVRKCWSLLIGPD
jgi:hypothetical protein